MSKVEIIVYLVYLVYLGLILTLVYILCNPYSESYNSGLKSKDVKYKTEQDMTVSKSQQSLEVPTPHHDQINYTNFNNKHKRNLHDIGNGPQSPTHTYNDNENNKIEYSRGPSANCGCKMHQ